MSKRDKHGALIDAELLAHVYIELLGGRQKSILNFANNEASSETTLTSTHHKPAQTIEFPKRSFLPSQSEIEEHLAFIQSFKNPLWDLFKISKE